MEIVMKHLFTISLLFVALGYKTQAAEPPATPNFIVILCDNLGYGDIGCYGSKLHRTPHIDKLAAEGMRLTDFYVSSGVCTPSRASLMTGCYPRRVNMHVSETGGSGRPLWKSGLCAVNWVASSRRLPTIKAGRIVRCIERREPLQHSTRTACMRRSFGCYSQVVPNLAVR